MPLAQVNNTAIFYEVNGAGDPLFLIPGLAADHHYYDLAIPSLSAHLQTIALDPRGIGQSVCTDHSFSIERWADDFAALVDHLGFDRVNVLGTSLGGATALALAVNHPQKVRSLIVVGAFSELNESVQLNYDLRKRLVARIGMSEEMADFIILWTLTSQFLDTPTGRATASFARKTIGDTSPQEYTGFLDAILKLGKRDAGGPEPYLTAQLPGITVPTLVACSDNDHFIPPKLSKVILDHLPNASYAEIHGGGHIPFLEQPEAIAQVVIDYLDSLNKSRWNSE